MMILRTIGKLNRSTLSNGFLQLSLHRLAEAVWARARSFRVVPSSSWYGQVVPDHPKSYHVVLGAPISTRRPASWLIPSRHISPYPSPSSKRGITDSSRVDPCHPIGPKVVQGRPMCCVCQWSCCKTIFQVRRKSQTTYMSGRVLKLSALLSTPYFNVGGRLGRPHSPN